MHGPSKLDMEWVEVNRCCSTITRVVCRVNPHTHLIEVSDTCCHAGRDAIVRKASLRAATVKLKGKQGVRHGEMHFTHNIWLNVCERNPFIIVPSRRRTAYTRASLSSILVSVYSFVHRTNSFSFFIILYQLPDHFYNSTTLSKRKYHDITCSQSH